MEELYFSVIDEETGEERLYCVNEVLSEEEYLERLYSECYEEERTFASVRKAKKLGKQMVNVINSSNSNGRKLIGQVNARLENAGFNKHVLKNSEKSGFDKVVNGVLGKTPNKAEEAKAVKGILVSHAKNLADRGGKRYTYGRELLSF